MARKPIVEIDVDDTRFKRFLDLFKAYSDKVDAMPEAWKKLDTAMSGAGKSMGGAATETHSQLALAATSTSLIVEALNKAATAQRGLGDATSGTARSMDRLATVAKGARDHITGVAGLLVRIAGWSGLGAALGGLGAGFGIAELAGSATGQSRSARGLGVSPGQLAAFRANLSTYVGTGVLAGAADAQADLSKRGLLATLGISPLAAETEDPAQIALQEITAVRRAWQATHNLNTAQAQAALQLGFSPADIRNIGSANARDLGQRMRAVTTDAPRLGFSDKVGRDWATLDTALQKAGVTIESSLIEGLSGLALPIGRLSGEISDFIAAFIKNDAPIVVDKVGAGLSWLANYLASPDFTGDMKVFGESVKVLGSETTRALRWFGLIPKDDQSIPGIPIDADDQVVNRIKNSDSSANSAKTEKAQLQRFLKDPMASWDFTSPEDQYKLPHGFLKSLAMVESSGDPTKVSPKGARGLFQFTDPTAKELGIDSSDVGQSAFGAALYTRQNLDRFGGDMRKAIAAYNMGPNALDADIKAHGADWERYLSKETEDEINRVLVLMGVKSQPTAPSQASASAASPVAPASPASPALPQPAPATRIIITNHTNARVYTQANAAGY